MTRPAWMDSGLCTQTDPDMFFPEKNQSARDAKRICDVCPVANQCLTYALTNGFNSGVWGGLSAAERAKLRRAAA
jgi:WhiB family redox-sensing transcriptional regulator